MPQPIAALIYDFDQTLSPKNMQEYTFLPGIHIEADEFWKLCREFSIKHNMDGILSYMYMMNKMSGTVLTAQRLREMGEGIEFFPGVETWFERIRQIGRSMGLEVEHYVISSGLTEIIRGSRIGHEFKEVFAASFCCDEEGRPFWPSSVVNYTAKTQYLFRINKGIPDATNDRDLNAFTPAYMRRIPFANMIYLGDGLTDVPCMKMTKQKGGYSIAVHAPEVTDVADDMLLQNRADFSMVCDYTPGSELEKVVTLLLKCIRANADVTMAHALQVQRAHERRGENVPLNVPMRGGIQEDEME